MFAGGLAFAVEEASTQKDLEELACKDVMRLSGNQREYALAFVHGDRLVKMNTTQYEIEVLAAMTDQYIDHCLDNPKDNALATFEKIGKSQRGCR
ncbi:HdeA/HdeB family chaperone [Thiocapsa marina]